MCSESSEGQQSNKDSLEKLVARFLDPSVPEEERNKASLALLLIICQIARAAAYRVGVKRALISEWSEGAADHVIDKLLEGKFHPGKGRFLAWARRVCMNYLRDRKEFESRLVRDSELVARLNSSGGSEDGDEGISSIFDIVPAREQQQMSIFDTEFSPRDLHSVREWRPLRDRIVILSWTGLWVKVPESTWKEWVEDLGLDWPFPPESFLALEDLNERAHALASMFGLSRNHLSVIWRRRKCWLEKLHCIQELREEYCDEDL